MSYVITQKCVSEVYASCYEVCPVDCIHFVDSIPEGIADAGRATMIIDPEECIDCGACLIECPVGAIVEEESEDQVWAEINKKLTEKFKGQKPPEVRSQSDPPRRKDNKLVLT